MIDTSQVVYKPRNNPNKVLDEWAKEANRLHISYGELQARETSEYLRSLKRYQDWDKKF